MAGSAAAPATRCRNRRRGSFIDSSQGDECRPSLSRLVEISQIRRRLILFDRHQEAVRAEEIVLLADNNVDVVLDADVFPPPDRSLGCNATVVFDHGPGT